MLTSSSSGQDQQTPPQIDGSQIVTLATASASRRLPPPCWSHEETVALIDAYRDKWYSLRRGNLRASHWQEVADDVAVRCPVSTPKTSVQCRHKMEKLRKRYRAEIQRAVTYGGSRSQRYYSAWIHFKRMDAMEKGPNAATAGGTMDNDDNYDDEPEDSNIKRISDVYNTNGMNDSSSFSTRNNFHGSMTNGGSGFRIRIPGKGGMGASGVSRYSNSNEMGGQVGNFNANLSGNSSSSKVLRDGLGGRGKMEKRAVTVEAKKGDPVEDMVEAIRLLGDGFVRMEKMKMNMAREVEEMRMEMEAKKTEMFLESQQKIVEAFAEAISKGKSKKVKRKRIPEEEC